MNKFEAVLLISPDLSNPIIKKEEESFLSNINSLKGEIISTENWGLRDISFNINSTTQLSLFYGSQKGGLVCANGVCADQPGFDDGMKLTFRSLF